ncbi:hypothetical protein AKJ65_07655 [candidate division MSBL1 archaeon SCGC-AAA259E19]|uniref:Major facilitator superfamily (MFS) profile domain-containing protein n=1 Tax=candidate division MSBL1 archaeon SCGC-AAA259E19 TaxID=1698264 RepID=A0A133UDY0_9EURY|nr:hypothetical protein AKJ65_07655 [candidate division MSBL1 archaeon SCGC-AAA259E19]
MDDLKKEERRILLYFLGISLGYVGLLGGLIVFILLILGVSTKFLGGVLSAYLALALAVLMTFLHRPLEEFGLKKFFGVGSGIFLLSSLILLFGHFVE